jgi:hypothetical protein
MKTELPARQLGLPNLDKRWHKATERFVVPANVFEPTRYRVDTVTHRDAKAFVLKEHYSGSWVAARFTFGMYCEALRRRSGVRRRISPHNQRLRRASHSVTRNAGMLRDRQRLRHGIHHPGWPRTTLAGQTESR